jgi:hypothetical protein
MTEELVMGGVLAPMRAASWFRDGRRPAEEGRSGLATSGPDCETADEFVLMAGSSVVNGGGSYTRGSHKAHLPQLAIFMQRIITSSRLVLVHQIRFN